MMTSNGQTNETLYEQVLDFARKEIEDASSQMDELRRALHLVESRVEAAKSVYESVAARLNLEDELEDEARLGATPLPEMPKQAPISASTPPPVSAPQAETPKEEPMIFAPEPPPTAPAPPPVAQTPKPVAPEPPPVLDQPPVTPKPEPAMFAPESPPVAPTPPPVVQEPEPIASTPSAPTQPEEKQPVEASGTANGNGAADGFSMDLIRKHLESREKAAQAASQAPTKRPAPEPTSEPAGSEGSVQAETAPPPMPSVAAASTPAPAPAPAPTPAPAPVAAPPKPATETPAATQPAQGGFPGLSEADRALIGEYLRSKRD